VDITSWSYVLPPSSLGFSNEAADFTVVFYFSHFEQGIAWGVRDDMPPADGSLTVAKIAADLRPYISGGRSCRQPACL